MVLVLINNPTSQSCRKDRCRAFVTCYVPISLESLSCLSKSLMAMGQNKAWYSAVWLSHYLEAFDPRICKPVCSLVTKYVPWRKSCFYFILHKDGMWARGHLGSILSFHSLTLLDGAGRSLLQPCAAHTSLPCLLSPVPHGSE